MFTTFRVFKNILDGRPPFGHLWRGEQWGQYDSLREALACAERVVADDPLGFDGAQVHLIMTMHEDFGSMRRSTDVDLVLLEIPSRARQELIRCKECGDKEAEGRCWARMWDVRDGRRATWDETPVKEKP